MSVAGDQLSAAAPLQSKIFDAPISGLLGEGNPPPDQKSTERVVALREGRDFILAMENADQLSALIVNPKTDRAFERRKGEAKENIFRRDGGESRGWRRRRRDDRSRGRRFLFLGQRGCAEQEKEKSKAHLVAKL